MPISDATPAPPLPAWLDGELPFSRSLVRVGAYRMHVMQVGEGRPVLLLHGFPEFWYAWKDLLADFSKDHHAVAPDMRGYNLSSRPESAPGPANCGDHGSTPAGHEASCRSTSSLRDSAAWVYARQKFSNTASASAP